MSIASVLAVIFGYLLGSIPSAYIVASLRGVDLLKERDGHISATGVYREVGRLAFVIVIILDAGKGLASVKLAGALTGSTTVMVGAGLAAIVGHCWPVYLRFRGGLGAVVTYAVLGTLAFPAFAIGGGVAIIVVVTTRRSSLSSYALLAASSVALLVQMQELFLALSPLVMLAVQQLKRLQIRGEQAASGYANELFQDLRRMK